MLSRLWDLKVRFQFTSWLQYTPNAILSLICFLVGAGTWFLGWVAVAYPFIFVGTLLLAVLIFDLVTVKLKLRLPERLPQRQDDLDLFDLMRARRSCRSFQLRKLSPADYDELMASVRLHSAEPTIGQAPIRFEYVAAPLTVWPVVNATEFLIAIAPREYNRLAVIDVGRSLQKIVMEATRMGLGTCWIGPGADQASVAQHLGERFNPAEDHIICACAVGYKSWYMPLLVRVMNAQFQRRLPLSALFFDLSFQKPLPVEAPPFNRFGRTYEICQWSPSSYNGQTTRCIAVVEGNEDAPHLARFDFYEASESRYYAPVALGIWCADWELGCGALDIQGHFAVLSAVERGICDEKDRPQLPQYDVSWVLDQKL